jgi:hypothetical protein
MATYLGGSKRYETAYYRPGSGWTPPAGHKKHGRMRPAMAAGARGARVTPLTTASPRRPGFVTRAIIVGVVISVTVALATVLGGAVGL